ncbi:MAG TPA: ABC-2 family transporter protein [Acidimicrobiales bacterium]
MTAAAPASAAGTPAAARRRRPPRWAGVAVATGAGRMLAARGELVMGMAIQVLIVSAVSALWRVAVEANGGLLDGYDARSLTWYIAVSEAVYMAVSSRIIEEIGADIATGAVASEMLRPAPVIGVRLATQFGATLPRAVANLTAGCGVALVTVGAPPSWGALLLALPAIPLGAACNLVAAHAFAGAAFWLRDAGSAWFLYQKLIFIFGGMLLPLQVLPGPMRAVAFGLPLMTMAYVPARLASGHVEPFLLLVQAGWLVVLTVLAAAVFRAGERRLQTVGG